MDLTAREINEKQFHDAWRGYNQEEVDDFLDAVGDTLDRTLRENAMLLERVRDLEQANTTSREREEMLSKTLVSAQQAAEEAIGKARARAEQLIGEAEARAKRAREEMQERVQQAEAEIKRRSEEAEREHARRTEETEREHATRQRELEATIERLRAQETELKQRLKAFLQQQLSAVERLVESPREDAPEPQPGQQRPQARPSAQQEEGSPTDLRIEVGAETNGGAEVTELPIPEEQPAEHQRRKLFWRHEA